MPVEAILVSVACVRLTHGTRDRIRAVSTPNAVPLVVSDGRLIRVDIDKSPQLSENAARAV